MKTRAFTGQGKLEVSLFSETDSPQTGGQMTERANGTKVRPVQRILDALQSPNLGRTERKYRDITRRANP
jgi:hypothetical protein